MLSDLFTAFILHPKKNVFYGLMIVNTQTKLSIFNLVCHYFLVSCFIHLFNHRHYWCSLLWWYFLTQIGICPLVSCISRFVTLFLCRTLFLFFAPIFICFFTLFHIDFRLYLRLCSLRYWPSKFQYHSIQDYIISNKFLFCNLNYLWPGLKRCSIIPYKHRIYQLPHELLNDLGLTILGNQKKSGKPQNLKEK